MRAAFQIRCWAAVVTAAACHGVDQGERESPRDIVGTRLAVGGGHNHLVLPDGTLATWGGSIYGAAGVPYEVDGPNPPSTTDLQADVVAAAAGTDHSCAVLDDGRVNCWGRNDVGQLGLGDTENRGDDPGEMGASLPFVDLGTDEHAVAVSCGGRFSCVLLEGSSVKCWGYNANGELGQGDTEYRGDEPSEMGDALPAIDLGTTREVIELDAGFQHVCVLLDDGKIKCWGNSSSATYTLGRSNVANIGDASGQMGDALPVVSLGTDAIVESFSAGGYHSCALLVGGGLKCWGQGSFTEPCPDPDEMCVYPRPRYLGGRLGYGDLENRGADPKMGDNLPLVDLGTDARVVAVDAGSTHTCALLDSGRLKCWGAHSFNKLGIDVNNDIGDEPGEMGDALPPVDLGTGRTVAAFAASLNATCVVLDDDGVKCWGSPEYGTEMGDALPYIALP